MIEQLITDHLDLWSSAVRPKSSAGRGSNNKLELTGIKKLRELILELAVRGKLVPQEPNDEPASVLLERIAAEKARLVKEGKIKKSKPLPEITEDEIPFELPEGWMWCHLQSVTSYIQRGKGPTYADSGYVKVVSQKCIQWSGLDLEPARFIVDSSVDSYSEDRFLMTNDLLWNSTGTGTVGRVNVIADIECNKFVADSHVTVIRPISINSNFLWCYISAPEIQARIEPDHEYSLVSGSTKQVELNTSAVVSLEIPIPPLAEQHRIVAKVDELMSLCDQLEQKSEASLAAHQTLVETLLATLTESADSSELAKNWARLAQHFDSLFTTQSSIDALKQSILQLAVMGKLVPQDPNDEPASVLLELIATEKARLVKEGKIKKEKPLPPISKEEKPFALPDGWEWVRFASLSDEVATGPFGSMINKSEYISGGVPLINPSHMIGSKIVEDPEISVDQGKASQLDSYRIKNGDIVMARRGEMGRCALVTARENDWLCGTGSFILRLNSELSREFIILMFKSEWVINYLGGNSVGSTMVNLNHGILNKLPLMLPPKQEQRSIVSKVDELMSLCDQLSARLQASQTTQLHLAEALVEGALN